MTWVRLVVSQSRHRMQVGLVYAADAALLMECRRSVMRGCARWFWFRNAVAKCSDGSVPGMFNRRAAGFPGFGYVQEEHATVIDIQYPAIWPTSRPSSTPRASKLVGRTLHPATVHRKSG